jgi:hypothetical protein
VSLIDEIAGAWRLLRWESQAADGAVSLPFGDGLIGRLVFTSSCYMSAQIMLPEGRDLEPGPALVAGPQRYIAYCGRFAVDEAARTITTHVEASVSRSWVGTDQVRRVEVVGSTLRLMPPRRPSGDQAAIVWQRLDA